jgi:hypothetical protein
MASSSDHWSVSDRMEKVGIIGIPETALLQNQAAWLPNFFAQDPEWCPLS